MNIVDFLFENNRNLDKDFVVGTSEKISFEELYRKTITIASGLHAKYGDGNKFLLISDNSLFFIISYLAIIKSNNVVMLAETRMAEKDLSFIINDNSLKGCFVQELFRKRAEKLIEDSKYDQDLISEKDLIKLEKDLENKKSGIVQKNDLFDSDNLAVIIFTSGITGEKKGVMLSHKNIIANTQSIVEYLKLTEGDRMEVVLPFFYCYGVSLLHTHLRIGASIVLNKGFFLKCLDEIDKYKCTGLAGVPATFQILVNKTDFLKRKFPSIRYFTQAGGKLANSYISCIADSFKDKLFFVMYGATEATARLSYLEPVLVTKKLGSIGKAIPGVTLEVLDNKGGKIKPGQIGEITARGDNIMSGYYKDRTETNKVLRNGRYYTGDIATIDEDDFIYILGRSKSIIKSAGHRISPQEIEELIISIDGVSGAVVVGMPDKLTGEAVAALVESKENSEKFKQKIITYCNKKLPSYKVPKKIEITKNLLLNSSNKIDRAKVKEMILRKHENEETNTKN